MKTSPSDDRKLEQLVAHYLRCFAPCRQADQERFAKMPDLATAIRNASLARRADGKCESHQRRVGLTRLKHFERSLRQVHDVIAQCRTFRDLHTVVSEKRIDGIGPLTVYDTAVRIGAFLRVAPENVYLHTGTRKGAKMLGLIASSGCVEPEELPPPLRRLSPDDVENFLCIFKDAFWGPFRSRNRSQPYQYALAPTSQFYFCGVPLRLDTSPKCSLNCLYCFAMARGGRRTSKCMRANPDWLGRKLELIFERGIVPDLAAEMLLRRVPIHFGGLSDPFSDEDSTRRSREMLRYIARYGCPVVLSTKNTEELLREETLSLLKAVGPISIQISIATIGGVFSACAESAAPSPEVRVAAIAALSREGIHCTCRIQPLLVPEIRHVVSKLIPAIADAGCSHVIVEFLKLPVERNVALLRGFQRAVGWDASAYYKAHGAQLVGREWLLPPSLKWHLLQPVIEAIHNNGMTYGAGDYGLHHLGDTRCCCGVDGLRGFGNWFKGSIANLLTVRRGQCLSLSRSVGIWFPKMSLRRIMNSTCRLDGQDQNMKQYIEKKWNSPGTTNAPDAYLGVKWNGHRDEHGHCLYEHDPDFQ